MEKNATVTPNPEKCYSIYSSSEVVSGATLKDISEETFHGITCLRGISVRKDSWSEGRIIRIPIQQISMIVEFDSLEDLYNRRRKSKKVTGLLGAICRNSR